MVYSSLSLLIVTTNFILLLFLLVILFSKIKKQFGKIEKKTWLILMLIMFIDSILIISLPKMHFSAYSTEYIQLNVANNIFEKGYPATCEYVDYEVLNCQEYHGSLGFPLLISFSFFIFGRGNYVAINTVGFFGILSSLLIFLISFTIFKNEKLALLSAFLISFSPLYVLLSSSASIFIVSNFFMLLTTMGLFLYFNTKDIRVLLFSLASLAFLVHTFETFILIPFLFFALLYKEDKKRTNFLLTITFFLILISPIFFQEFDFYIPSQDQMKNLSQMFMPFFMHKSLPFFYPLLCLSLPGIYFLLREKNKIKTFLLGFLFISLVSIPFKELYFDYFIVLCPALIIISLTGIKIFKARFGNKIITALLIIWVALFSYCFYYMQQPEIIHTELEIIETKLADNVDNIVKPNCYVMTATPEVVMSTSNVKAIRIKNMNEKIKENIMKNAGCLVFFYNQWCFLERSGYVFNNLKSNSKNCNFDFNVELPSVPNKIGFYTMS